MNKIQRYLLKKIAEKIIRQGPWHEANTIEYFMIMTRAARDEFTEDNKAIIDKYLKGCLNVALETWH